MCVTHYVLCIIYYAQYMFLLPELRSIVLCNLDPLSLRRYAAASKTCYIEASVHVHSLEHAQYIAKDAVNYIANLIVKSHHNCDNPNLIQLAVEFAANMASTLAKTQKPMVCWNYDEMLNFLYPTAIGLISNWKLAPYAIEWCATISGNDPIQLAFARDPMAALVEYIQEPIDPVCVSFANIAVAACKTKSDIKFEIINTISSLAFSAGHYADNEDKLSCVAITWAIAIATLRCEIDWSLPRSMVNTRYVLVNLVSALRSLSKFTNSSRSQWLNRLGFIGFDRSPHYMMSDFKCNDSPVQDILVYAAMINENEIS